MIDILVQRGNGDIAGSPVVDPLISSISVAIARGRAEIDAQQSVRKLRLVASLDARVRPGLLVDVVDGISGICWRGKIVGVEHVADGQTVSTRLDVEVPL